MPEVIGAVASDFGDSASGGGVMPASPQNSALDNTGNDVRHIGCHVWMPLDKDVIDQVLNAALAKMTTSTEGDKSVDQKDNKNTEGGKRKNNDLNIYDKETASPISMDENKNSKLKNKENVQESVNSLNAENEDGSSYIVNDICGFTARGKRANTPDSGVSDSRSSGSPILNDGWVPVPRSALDTLIASEFGKFEEHESQQKTQSSTENRVQTVSENSPGDLDHYKRDQPSRTNPNIFSHSSPLNICRNASVIVSRQPDKETVAASLPKDTQKPSQLNVTTTQNQKCRPAEHTAKEKATESDTSSCTTTDNETPSWVMVQKATLENMVESAMTKGSCDAHDPAKKADIAKLPVKSKPAVKQSENVTNKNGSNTIKKRINTKQKRPAGNSQNYSKRPRISEAPAMPYHPPSSASTGMYGRINSLQELLQPGTDLSVHTTPIGHPLNIPQYPVRFVPPHLQSVVPGMNRLPVPALLPISEFGVGSAFRPPVSAPHSIPTENHLVPKKSPPGGHNVGEPTPLDLSQKESSLTMKPPVARLTDNNNSAIPAVHRAPPPALVNNVNGMPVNNQSVLHEPAPSSVVGSVHNTQAKAIRLSAESAPTVFGKQVRKASPRPEDMGTSSPRGSPWVVLDINQVDNIFDRVLQEEHSPRPVSQGADQTNDSSAVSGVEKSSQGSKVDGLKDIPRSPCDLENDKNSESAKEDVASVHSDRSSSPQLNGLDERESSPGLSGGSSAGGPSSPKQGSPGGFKWKSDLLRKFNGGTDDSDSSSPRDHSPSPAPSLPQNASFACFLGENQNNNPVIPETSRRQGRNKKKKSKKGTKKQSNSR